MSREAVQLDAEDLRIGDTKYTDCHFCGRRNKLGVTRNPDGILYHCFSINCGASGFVPDHVWSAETYQPKPRFTRWIGVPSAVTVSDENFFQMSFQIKVGEDGWKIYVTPHDEYLFPIRDYLGKRVGEVVRQPRWFGTSRQGRRNMPKALTYLDSDKSRLSWHFGLEGYPIILVEDQVSAERVSQLTGCTGVALLGSSLGSKEAADISGYQRGFGGAVVIWLDPDMHKQAFQLNEKYGQQFGGSRVIMSGEDPKDLNPDELRLILSE